MREKIVRQTNAWLPVLIWAGIIFKLSSGAVPSVSTIYIQDFIFKKGAHMFFFGMLSILVYRALIINNVAKNKVVILAILAATVYGMSDEFHQSFTQVREARIRDIGFDTIGGVIAVSMCYYLLPKLPTRIRNSFKKFDLL